ncbi:MAG TPA: cation diffusion facilitator family transporter, partial [Acidimicrobiia bacterium]|nr:cation diffusion facilitator family transporter [Acidimicrobiia bacterium]
MNRPAGLAATRRARLRTAVALTVVLAAGELVAGVLGHASALLADAGHNLTDVVALAASLVALSWAGRPRNDQRSFGNHRATILAALFSSGVLAVVTASIVAVSVGRLLHPQPVDGAVLAGVAAAAVFANGLAALALREPGGSDLNMRAAFLHVVADVASAGFALAAGVAIVIGGTAAELADPAAALAVSAAIIVQVVRLARASVGVLLESTPDDVDLGSLREAITAVEGVSEVHDLHVWSLSSEVRALSAHLVASGHPSLEDAQDLAERVRAAICGPFALAHTTFELECERCSDTEDPCGVVASAEPAVAAGPGR